MSDLFVAIDSLRKEIQTDRIATHKLISDGFESIGGKLDAHATIDDSRFADLHERLVEVETKQTLLGRGVWGLIVSFCSGVGVWLLKGGKP